MAELEKAGIPTAAYVASDFAKDWRHSARAFGVTDLALVTLPRPLVGLKPADVYPYIDAAFEAMAYALTQPAERHESKDETPQPAGIISVEGVDRYHALEQMNHMFLEAGWGDGLPLWAPKIGRAHV